MLPAAAFALVWNENSGGGSTWTTRTIATTAFARIAFALEAADLDRDGDLDVVLSDFQTPALTWYENTAGNGSAWATHDLGTTLFANSSGMTVADVDGDGDRDVLVDAFGSRILWMENTAGNGSTWTGRTANASTQSPNQLHLTHLAVGTSASVAEHRAFDIPLRLACPTNVSSSIKQRCRWSCSGTRSSRALQGAVGVPPEWS